MMLTGFLRKAFLMAWRSQPLSSVLRKRERDLQDPSPSGAGTLISSYDQRLTVMVTVFLKGPDNQIHHMNRLKFLL